MPTTSPKPLVIWHGGCRDGFCAAWVVWRHYKGEADFFAAFHGQPPPDFIGREVIMVDFTYPRAVMKQIADLSKALIVLDHHKTALDSLADFPVISSGGGAHLFAPVHGIDAKPPYVTLVGAHLDFRHSGAGLAWTYFHGEGRADHPPPIVEYVEDRDLWRFRLPASREVNAWLSVLPFEFAEWESAAGIIGAHGHDLVVDLGRAVLRKIAQNAAELGKQARMLTLTEHGPVPVLNCPPIDVSETLEPLAATAPYAVGWFQRGDGLIQYSLRSRAGGVDVSEVAKRFGGGGHPAAAGFESEWGPDDLAREWRWANNHWYER